MSAASHSNSAAASNEMPRDAIFREFLAASKLMPTYLLYIRIYKNSTHDGRAGSASCDGHVSVRNRRRLDRATHCRTLPDIAPRAAQIHTPIARGDHSVAKTMIPKRWAGDSRMFDSHRPLHPRSTSGNLGHPNRAQVRAGTGSCWQSVTPCQRTHGSGAEPEPVTQLPAATPRLRNREHRRLLL
jgi:hypothetical protein